MNGTRYAVNLNVKIHIKKKGGTDDMIKLSASNVVGLIILMCILAAMVSIAIMQVVRTVEDIGPKIYVIGGAVALVGALIPIMLIILVRHLKKIG
jgi:hypothetical protein